MYYKVTFEHSENVYCTNIAVADSVEAVKDHYSKYSWVNVRECDEWEVEEGKNKGMPVITIETKEEPEAVEDSKEEKGEKAMFNNIRTALTEHYGKEFEKFAADLSGITAGEVVNSWYYRELCTPSVYKKIATMAPDAAIGPDLLDRIKAKKARNNKKAMSLYTAKLDAAEAARDVTTIDISVEWKKSRTWGANPTATVCGSGSYSTGYASGCGYDKESAAIASAFNDNPGIMRILYEHAEKGGAFPYGVTSWAGVPSFDGGCGVSVFYNIFDACGYTFRCVAGGKMFDAYTITKK